MAEQEGTAGTRGSLGSSPGDTGPARPQFHLCSARGPAQGREWGLGFAVPSGTKGQRARQGEEGAHGEDRRRANTARSAPPPLPAALPTPPPPSPWDRHSAVSALRSPGQGDSPAVTRSPSRGLPSPVRWHSVAWPRRSGLRGGPHP